MTWHDKWLSLFAWIYSRKCTQQLLKKSFITDFCPPCTWLKSSQNPTHIIPDVQPRMSEVSNNSKTLFTVKFNGTNSVSVSSTASKEGKVTENGGSSCKCSWYLLKRVEKNKIKLKLKKNIISRKANAQKTSTLNIFSSEWGHHDSGCSTKCEWDPSLGNKTTLCQPPTTKWRKPRCNIPSVYDTHPTNPKLTPRRIYIYLDGEYFARALKGKSKICFLDIIDVN